MKQIYFGTACVMASIALSKTVSADGLVDVALNTVEPSAAAHQQQALSGNCYGREVSVQFDRGSSTTASKITVRIGGKSQTYTQSQPFERALNQGSKTAFQFWIVCDNDKDKQVLLTAWGISP
jgi:hypothetical protein